MDHECELSVDQHKDEPEVNGPQILSWSFQEVTVKNPVILSGEPIIVVIGHLLNKGSPGITGSWIPKAPMKGFWWHLHVGSFSARRCHHLETFHRVLDMWFPIYSKKSHSLSRFPAWGLQWRGRQADTKDLTSSSKFSGSCVLTLQPLLLFSSLSTASWFSYKRLDRREVRSLQSYSTHVHHLWTQESMVIIIRVLDYLRDFKSRVTSSSSFQRIHHDNLRIDSVSQKEKSKDAVNILSNYSWWGCQTVSSCTKGKRWE